MMTRRGFVALAAVCAAFAFGAGCKKKKSAPRGGRELRLATTSSVVDSGLLATLLPAFEKQSGYRVTVSSVGSGRALEMLAAGSADVAITHAPGAEQTALAAGTASRRTPFARNDFVIVGPPGETHHFAGAADIRDVMRAIADSEHGFVSRGDDSGTHKKEKTLWELAGVTAKKSFVSNAGMADTLARADKEDAFTLTDRATFIARKKKLALAILFQGDDDLSNPYSILEPPAAAKANHDGARALVDYLRSPAGRALVGAFGVKDHAEALFVPLD